VGGGRVLDPAPPRRLDPRRLEVLARTDPAEIVRAIVRAPVTGVDLQARALLAPPDLARGLAAVQQAGDWYFAAEWLDDLRTRARERLAERAERSPLDPGLPLAELLPAEPWAAQIAPLLRFERRGAKAYLPGVVAALGEREAEAERLEAALQEAAGNAVKVDDAELARFLEQQGRLVRVGDGLAVSAAAFGLARAALVGECEAAGRITLARFRDLLGISRRSAQLLLERFDADGLTRRVGDERVLRRAARA
jgi:selenocysteine-specific elongation factor